MALLAGCGAEPQVASGPVVAEAPDGIPADAIAAPIYGPSAYFLRPRDVVSIQVRGEPSLSSERIRIGEDGMIMAPGVGAIMAAGRTPVEISSLVEAQLSRVYLRDPNVAVNVVELGSHQVTVEGGVEEPGIFSFNPGATLLGAVALGGGTTREARKDQILLFRTIDDVPMVARFDLEAMRSGRMIDPAIMPGDRVVIGESGRAFLIQDILSALPVAALFTRF